MNKLPITIILFISFASISTAQTGELELYKELEQAEKELNVVSEELKENMSDIHLSLLKESQDDWLKYRESHCNFKSQKDDEGGVITNKFYMGCKIQMTEQRTQDLSDCIGEF